MRNRTNSQNVLLTGILAGLALAIVLIATIFISRQTFGQRCFDAGFRDDEIRICAERLSKGEDIWG